MNSISSNSYKETKITRVDPIYLEKIISTHHFHTNGIFTVFDHGKNEII